MNFRILNSAELAKCPHNNLTPRHWIPEHHIEECHLDMCEAVEAEKRRLNSLLAKITEDLKHRRDEALLHFITTLREKHGS